MKIKDLNVYRELHKNDGREIWGVFWSTEGGDWTQTHKRGTYKEISDHVAESLPIRLPTKEKIKEIEERGRGVVYNWGGGVVYIRIIENGEFVD